MLGMVDGTSSSGVDLRVPLLCVSMGDGFLPIDGWSRIAKAKAEQVGTLPAVVLTTEEGDSVRVDSRTSLDTRQCEVRLLATIWDAAKAAKIARTASDTDVELAALDYSGLLEMLDSSVLAGSDQVFPVTCVRYGGNGRLPIYGLDRLWKAVKDGARTVPAVLLSRSESNSVRLV
jgi:hypothetical protein